MFSLNDLLHRVALGFTTHTLLKPDEEWLQRRAEEYLVLFRQHMTENRPDPTVVKSHFYDGYECATREAFKFWEGKGD